MAELVDITLNSTAQTPHLAPLNLQNNWANFKKLDTKLAWVKGIQNHTNVGPYPFPRGHNYEI